MNEKKIKDYMRAMIDEYRDKHTDEVDLAALAEDTCDEFNAHIIGTTSMGFPYISIPEEFSKWALEIIDELNFIQLYTE